jgi:endonuclease YncB( thermonuclease family)
MPMHGLDSNVLWALAIAAIAFAIWAAANSDSALQLGGRLLPGSLRHWFAQFFGRAGERLSLLAWPTAIKRRVAAVTVLAVVAAGSTWFVVRDGASLPSLPSLAALSPFSSEPIKGRASTLTGNLVRVGGQIIQLYGVEAPEPGQRCRTRRGRWWRCGNRARSALAGLVNGRTLKCEVMGHDDSGRALGHCFAGRRDIGGTLIRRGFVFVSADHPRGYRKLEATARKARKGFWGSKVQRPSEYRAKRWAAAKRQAPDGCPIKGDVTSRGKVYVLPWSSNYRRIRIQMKRGERWFCSEREAIRAGWRLTSRS